MAHAHLVNLHIIIQREKPLLGPSDQVTCGVNTSKSRSVETAGEELHDRSDLPMQRLDRQRHVTCNRDTAHVTCINYASEGAAVFGIG